MPPAKTQATQPPAAKSPPPQDPKVPKATKSGPTKRGRIIDNKAAQPPQAADAATPTEQAATKPKVQGPPKKVTKRGSVTDTSNLTLTAMFGPAPQAPPQKVAGDKTESTEALPLQDRPLATDQPIPQPIADDASRQPSPKASGTPPNSRKQSTLIPKAGSPSVVNSGGVASSSDMHSPELNSLAALAQNTSTGTHETAAPELSATSRAIINSPLPLPPASWAPPAPPAVSVKSLQLLADSSHDNPDIVDDDNSTLQESAVPTAEAAAPAAAAAASTPNSANPEAFAEPIGTVTGAASGATAEVDTDIRPSKEQQGFDLEPEVSSIIAPSAQVPSAPVPPSLETLEAALRTSSILPPPKKARRSKAASKSVGFQLSDSSGESQDDLGSNSSSDSIVFGVHKDKRYKPKPTDTVEGHSISLPKSTPGSISPKQMHTKSPTQSPQKLQPNILAMTVPVPKCRRERHFSYVETFLAIPPGTHKLPDRPSVPGTEWWADFMWEITRPVRSKARTPHRDMRHEGLCWGTGSEALAHLVMALPVVSLGAADKRCVARPMEPRALERRNSAPVERQQRFHGQQGRMLVAS